MKILKIFQENCSTIELKDDDDRDIGTYIKELTSVVNLDNISILHLSNSSVILKPSKILSIVVSEENISKEISKKEKKSIIKNNKDEEIITDME